MKAGFNVGDGVQVTGELARLFSGQTGTVLEVVMCHADNPDYSVYRVRFEGKHVRLIGRYLKSAESRGTIYTICA